MRPRVINGVRPAAAADTLARHAKVIAQWLDALEGEAPQGAFDCAICGRGEHVAMCPIPDLKEARRKLSFMASVPMENVVPTRGQAW